MDTQTDTNDFYPSNSQEGGCQTDDNVYALVAVSEVVDKTDTKKSKYDDGSNVTTKYRGLQNQGAT